MMKLKGLLSTLALLVFAGAMVASSTGAFFSDSETSTGNRFTAGALDLLVDSQSHYNGMVCTEVEEGVFEWQPEDGFEPGPGHHPEEGTPCDGSWELTNLGPTFKFFNLSDLKPGDSGENTISLHVEDNPAYVCAVIDNMEDNDLGLTEPEEGDGDNTDGPGNGELSSQIRFFAWSELDGDNVWEPANDEEMLFSNEEGPASDVIDGVSYPLFTPAPGGVGPTDPTVTNYIGLYWCYGDITVTPGAGSFEDRLTCDGSAVNNITQSDQLVADFSFYAEQARHNEDFECPGEITLPGDDDDDASDDDDDDDTVGDDDDDDTPQGPTLVATSSATTTNMGVSYQSFRNQAPTDAPNEVILGKMPLVGGGHSEEDQLWLAGTNTVSFIYSTTTDTLTSIVNGSAPLVYNNVSANTTCPVAQWDIFQVKVKEENGADVVVNGLTVDGNVFPNLIGSLTGNIWYILGLNLTDGFTATAKIVLTGTFGNNGAGNEVELSVGCGN